MTNEELADLVRKLNERLDLATKGLNILRDLSILQSQRIQNLENFLGLDKAPSEARP